jgi:hypothetical protein
MGIVAERERAAAWRIGPAAALLSFAATGAAQTTGSPSQDIIQGRLIPGGVECPLFRLDDGREATLQGVSSADAMAGGRLTLRGQWIDISTCQQGRTFLVTEVIERGG